MRTFYYQNYSIIWQFEIHALLKLFVLELVFPVIRQRSPNVVDSRHVILQVVVSSVLSIADLTRVLDFQVSVSVVSLQLIPPVRLIVTVIAL